MLCRKGPDDYLNDVMDNIESFEGGTKGARDKLNRMAKATNEHNAIRGDEVYISVARTDDTGTVVSLNAQQILRRVPRTYVPTVVWIKIGQPYPATLGSGSPPKGGGGWYHCLPLNGNPNVNDPVEDLVIPKNDGEGNGESFPPDAGTYSAGVAQNTLEANKGDLSNPPPLHYVQPDTIVPSWIIPPLTNEEDPEPVYRFALPIPGARTIEIHDALGNETDAGGNGRYWGVVIWGRAEGIDSAGTNLVLPDTGETHGAPGTGTSGLMYYVEVENVKENNLTSPSIPGTACLLPVYDTGDAGYGSNFVYEDGRPTEGYSKNKVPTGYANSGLPAPIWRIDTLPQYVMTVDLVKDGGDDATSDGGEWVAATYTYTVKIPGTTIILMKNASPVCQRISTPLIAPATHGTIRIRVDGVLELYWACEQPLIAPPCTPTS